VRVTIVNLFYPPDLSPTAHMTAALAEHRVALGDDVTVVSGSGSYLGGSKRTRAGPSAEEGPRVVTLWTPSFGKETTARRIGDYLTFLIGATVRLIVLRRQDVVIALTSPPFILVAALAHRLLHPRTRVILWSHDVYPDAAEVFGAIRPGGALSRIMRAANRWLLRRVDHVIAMDPAMRDRIESSSPVDEQPISSSDRWDGYADPDLDGRFIVLHLGNLSYGHRTDTIADVAAAFGNDHVTFLFVGGGVGFPELAREAQRRRVHNIRFRDYVPRERTPAVLAGADCTLISFDDRSIGIQSPCKVNGSLAMGLPIVYAGPEGSNVDRAIVEYGCGFSLRQGDVVGVVEAIRRLRSDPALAAELSRNARRAFEEAHSDRSALPRFDAVIDSLQPESDRVAG
jgi:colanic acid biosynthesis glycosyl transferase WcaI